MPRLIRLYLHSVATGFALAAGFVALLLWADPGGFGALVLRSDRAVMAVAMLVAFNGIVFAGVQFAIRVMLLADREPEGPGPGHRQALLPEPVPVRAAAPGGGNRSDRGGVSFPRTR